MRRSTVIYVLLFVLVLAAAYFFNKHTQAADIATETASVEPVEYLFTPADGLPAFIRIESKAGEIVSVERNAENAWIVLLPTAGAADQGSVEAAASQVTTMRILQRLPDLAPESVGLDNPEYTMKFSFTSGVERILMVGVITPTESGYYALGEDGKVVIISKNAVDSLLELLTTPPYAPAETLVPATP